MSKTQEALKLALEAIEHLSHNARKAGVEMGLAFVVAEEAADAIREALAEQPAQQEPVAWWIPKHKAPDMVSKVRWSDECEPLYTSPPTLSLAEQPAQQEPRKQEPVAKDWSVFNTGAEVWSGLSLEDAVAELTPERMERGWSAVCVINSDNPPLYTSPPAQQEPGRNHWEDGDVFERIGAMKKQPAQQEPVAWRVKVETKLRDGSVDFGYQLRNERLSKYDEPLYTSPPAQRKPLTNEQITKCWGQVEGTRHGYVAFARAIEAAHGIKENT